ncbi:hypothetical protein ONS95_004599 [Cadophora gregata]|uniref:uncharacterized protein n=1 Tax=Cadophora gregata TaxID=51156 RepID=UPI0026DC8419|nr:uncharacterized protein ONS95_004599 [Cadophora gregata]KAK0105033.1 hypothetical protein ONS96_004438 [Cadophora gregata f. sp. sojae]KAK0106095.1 hypothetical protein ONS95_004599 [Cadophora gregata]
MVVDIAIVGCGPSGLALAGIFERSGFSYVVYERSAHDVPPRGGCLDLHPGTGQLAMEEAGCYEKFKEFGRVGDYTVHQVWSPQGEKVFKWGVGEDQPELDREQIKQALLTTIEKGRIEWRKKVTSSERNEKGQILLKFEDGTTAKGFKLVIGADGLRSKIRHLVTPAKPKYSGFTFWTGEMHTTNPFYPTLEEMAKFGPMAVFGRSVMIWIQRQGDGHYRLDLGIPCPEEFDKIKGIDLADAEAVKRFALAEFNNGHSENLKAIIRAIEGPFHAWPLYYMPPDAINWEASSDVTLIGDAAHVTTPFVGEGVNMAMKDSVVLARKLKEFGATLRAVEEYEKEMFPRSREVIEMSLASGKLCFEWDAPRDGLDRGRRVEWD